MKVMHAPYSYKVFSLSRLTGHWFLRRDLCQGFAVKSECSVSILASHDE